ncbi:hypothetical protein FHW88_006096 [Mucilaginibacter sp. SG538B]|nr:hypothetical protein [Mucilaginibacter sp. SG538B]
MQRCGQSDIIHYHRPSYGNGIQSIVLKKSVLNNLKAIVNVCLQKENEPKTRT